MDPKKYQFDLPQSGRPDPFKIPEEYYPGVLDYMKKRSRRRPSSAIDAINTFVIHATAGGSSSGAMDVMRTGEVLIGGKIKKVKSSWHWLVPDENEKQHGKFVWSCVWESRAAFHVRDSVSHADVNGGKKRINDHSLGIEIVNTQNNDKFSDWQVEITAAIVRYAWSVYPNLKQIVSHAKLDPGRRTDPGKDFPWSKFKNLVLSGPPIPKIEKPQLLSALPAATPPTNDCCSIT